MKYLYVISIVDSGGRQVSWGITATSLADAVTKAQTEAGVESDPLTTQRLAQIDFEVS
jgi:hypothetical protein